MARATATVAFNAIEVKGSLLPGSLLDQVAHFKAKQQAPKDYGLEKNARLRDRIDAAWVLAKDLWADYRGLKERAGQGVAALHFSLRLLREVFEWDDLQPVAGWQQGEAQYPITHRAFGGTVPLILKGVATGDLDQGLKQFGQENRKRSPHSCLQECLNADDGANWGLLCSGDRLRLLHDNASLVKPAYLGADLEWLIEGDLFDEFAVLWLTLHASRFLPAVDEGASQNGCVLDSWKREAEDTGERILNQLRGGVESALEHLGNGVLAHQANQDLRLALESGELSRQAFHEELLRLVYRFLFLFTAEDRELLFAQEVGKEDHRRQIYREGYSLGRLRELALKRSVYEGNYGDLWQLQRLVFQQLSISSSPLGLPGLGGLFDTKQCPNLQGCELDNRYLLRAIKAIGWFEAGKTLTRVNYRDLNTEELGSVYEGLLELHPHVDQVGSRMQLSYGAAAGSDRKTTGSYYTPDGLVKLLIESALLPVIQERLSNAETIEAKIDALLAIRVLDPACGSGHFLLAAGRRLALELARLRACDDEPSEALRQQCLREVVAQCLYGVDKNPMAVELCKVALWIEAIDPGKPLSFLDAHIQCGDSLVGVFDPKVLEEGIPEEAYKPLTGDNKTVCTSLKKDNAIARRNISRRGSNRGVQGSLDPSGSKPRSPGQSRLQVIEAMPDTTLPETAAKQAAYAVWLQETGSDAETLAANLYTAAFFLPKTANTRAQVPTTEHLLKSLDKQAIPADMELEVDQAAKDFFFFHWHLRFGEVMEKGGFDCVLGNPPWDRIKLYEKEFFSTRRPSIANAETTAAREKSIKALQVLDEELYHEYQLKLREIDAVIEWIRSKKRFPLSSSGELNTYTVFLENACSIVNHEGRSGLIVPTGFATDKSSNRLFLECIDSKLLISLFDFENRAGLFTDVHRSYRFSLVTLGHFHSAPVFSFFLATPRDLATPERVFAISADEMRKINPGTPSCPTFRSVRDKNLTLSIYDNSESRSATDDAQLLEKWSYKTFEFFHMSKDSKYFNTCDESTTKQYENSLRSPSPGARAEIEYVPLYESKLIHQFDVRWASFDSRKKDVVEVNVEMKANYEFVAAPRYWVEQAQVTLRLQRQDWDRQWFIAWRDITNATNERTAISALIPCGGAGHNLGVMLPMGLKSPRDALLLLSNLNSIVLDYVCRQKVGGSHLTVFILNQLPLLQPGSYNAEKKKFVIDRALRLCFGCIQMQGIAEEFDACVLPLEVNEALILRAELDSFYAHEYGLSRDELRYILDPADVMGPDYPSETFRVLKTNEIRQFGEYRTQRLVLEAWDRLFGGGP